MGDRTKTVVINGDLTIDWNLIRSREPEAKAPAWIQDVHSHVSWMCGGAALLCNLLQMIVPAAGYELLQPNFPVKDGTAKQTLGAEPPAVTSQPPKGLPECPRPESQWRRAA